MWSLLALPNSWHGGMRASSIVSLLFKSLGLQIQALQLREPWKTREFQRNSSSASPKNTDNLIGTSFCCPPLPPFPFLLRKYLPGTGPRPATSHLRRMRRGRGASPLEGRELRLQLRRDEALVVGDPAALGGWGVSGIRLAKSGPLFAGEKGKRKWFTGEKGKLRKNKRKKGKKGLQGQKWLKLPHERFPFAQKKSSKKDTHRCGQSSLGHSGKCVKIATPCYSMLRPQCPPKMCVLMLIRHKFHRLSCKNLATGQT